MSKNLYGWLPPELQNDFIKAGHNRYSFADAPDSAKGAKRVAVTRGKKTRTVKADNAQKGVAQAAIRQGNPNMRTERPVIAARLDKRAAVTAARATGVKGAVKAARVAGRAAVKTAQADPNSARSERKAARTKKTVEAPGVSTPGTPKVSPSDPAPEQRKYDDYTDDAGRNQPYSKKVA